MYIVSNESVLHYYRAKALTVFFSKAVLRESFEEEI